MIVLDGGIFSQVYVIYFVGSNFQCNDFGFVQIGEYLDPANGSYILIQTLFLETTNSKHFEEISDTGKVWDVVPYHPFPPFGVEVK